MKAKVGSSNLIPKQRQSAPVQRSQHQQGPSSAPHSQPDRPGARLHPSQEHPPDTTPCREHTLHGLCTPLTQQLPPWLVRQPPLPRRDNPGQMPSRITGRLQKRPPLAQHPESLAPTLHLGSALCSQILHAALVLSETCSQRPTC